MGHESHYALWDKKKDLRQSRLRLSLGLSFPGKGRCGRVGTLKWLLFAGCLEASCHIELSVYLYIETLEILQKGLGENLNCQTTIDSGEQKLQRVPWPLDSRGVCFFIVWALWWSRYISFFFFQTGDFVRQLPKQPGPNTLESVWSLEICGSCSNTSPDPQAWQDEITQPDRELCTQKQEANIMAGMCESQGHG